MTTPEENTLSVLHFNVCCSNIDHSLSFYKLLGFREAVAPGPGPFGKMGLGTVFRLPDDCEGRFCIMHWGPQPGGTVLDLIEWTRPRVRRERRAGLTQPGVARICLTVKSCRKTYDDLVKAGYKPYTEPLFIDMGIGNFYVFCCEDPDGVVMEFMEVLPQRKT